MIGQVGSVGMRLLGAARRIWGGAAGAQFRGGVSALKRRQWKSAKRGFGKSGEIFGRESGATAHLGRHGRKYALGAGLAGGYAAGKHRQKRKMMRGIHRRGDIGPYR